MTAPASGHYDLSWSDRNGLALIVLCVLAGAALTWRAASRPAPLGAEIPAWPTRVAAAAERIDPNTATAASLRRLPGIGPTIATRIVDYRAAHGPRPFNRPEDLAKVKYIGEATVRNIRPYLQLESQ